MINRMKGCTVMFICPHCHMELNDKNFFCSHCGRVTSSVDSCMDAILNSGKLDDLMQKAANAHRKIIVDGLRHIMIIDMETCQEIYDRLFKPCKEDDRNLTNE